MQGCRISTTILIGYNAPNKVSESAAVSIIDSALNIHWHLKRKTN